MTIYFIQCRASQKLYIGQTINPVARRWYSHRYYLLRGDHSNDYLQYAWNKYGEDGFKFGVLESNLESLRDLNYAEKFWIQLLRSRTFQDGFNIKEGGGSSKVALVTKKKLTASNGGKPVLHIPSEIEYYSQREAARRTGVHRRTVYRHCYQKVKNPEFKFIENE